jgi:hypothetical protein
MKNIQVLPTNKPSRLYFWEDKLVFGRLATTPMNRNIYITSDEEIKEGDYVGYPTLNNWVPVKYLGGDLTGGEKKIILTTDPDLIKDGVQPIDDEFLEWFVKNPSCENVKVELIEEIPSGFTFGMFGNDEPPTELVYKIIIPKEPKQEWTPTQGEQVWIKVFSNWPSGTYIGYDTTKHIHLVRENEEGGGNLLSSSKILPYKSMPNEPKQETLEEAAHEYFKRGQLGFEKASDTEEAFLKGAKWMQERMYSEEEVRKMLFDLGDVLFNNCQNGIKEGEPEKYFNVIIEPFKKK